MIRTVCFSLLAVLLFAAQAVSRVELITPGASVSKPAVDSAEWVKLASPVVQKSGDVELKITSMRCGSGLLEIAAELNQGNSFQVARVSAVGADGIPLSANGHLADNPAGGKLLSLTCAVPQNGVDSLDALEIELLPMSTRRGVGTLTVEQLRYPCLLGGRIAVQAGEWNLSSWPGHYLTTLYSASSLPVGLYHPVNTTRFLTLRLFTMNRPGEQWAVEPVDVVVLDADGRRLRTAYTGRLGGELQPLQPSRSYWGFHAVPKSGASAGALVTHVDPYGPVAAAGMKAGDIITRWSDQNVADSGEWMRDALAWVPGRPVNIAVLREGKSVRLTATSIADPQWAGIDEPARASADWLHKKVGLEKSSQFWMQCYVMDAYENGDPLPETFVPVELEFSVKELPRDYGALLFSFRDILIPECVTK